MSYPQRREIPSTKDVNPYINIVDIMFYICHSRKKNNVGTLKESSFTNIFNVVLRVHVCAPRNLRVQFRRVVSLAIVNYKSEKQIPVDSDLRDVRETDNRSN